MVPVDSTRNILPIILTEKSKGFKYSTAKIMSIIYMKSETGTICVEEGLSEGEMFM